MLDQLNEMNALPEEGLEKHKELFSSIEKLKENFPNVGVVLNKIPVSEKIKIFNATEPPAMQFKPKNLEEMGQFASEVKETKSETSIHLPYFKFDPETGNMEQKEEIIKMLKMETPNRFDVVTAHLGFKDADLILDEKGEWKDTEMANKVADELSDLFIAGLESGKTMTLENVRYRPRSHSAYREILGSKPEHLVAARKKMVQVVSERTGLPVEKILEKTGYTFDTGHAADNAHLFEQYPLEIWMKQLGGDIKLLHIHDAVKQKPEDPEGTNHAHRALGEGIIDWKNFFQLRKEYCPNAPMVLEITEPETIKSVEYLTENKISTI